MSDAFFRDLRLPEPDHHLGVGSGSHAEQTGGVMIAYERLCLAARPDWIVVVGDVNSTMACALVGAKLGIPGGASRGRAAQRRPHACPRRSTASSPTRSPTCCGRRRRTPTSNLRAEGRAAGADRARRQHHDRFLRADARAHRRQPDAGDRFGLAAQGYGVVTLHRPSTWTIRQRSGRPGGGAVRRCRASCRWSFPVHPRTRQRLEEFGLMPTLAACEGTAAGGAAWATSIS